MNNKVTKLMLEKKNNMQKLDNNTNFEEENSIVISNN